MLKRNEWIEEQFEETDEKIKGLLEREDWTRNRFEETDEKIKGLLEREDWTRNRFEEQQKMIEKLQGNVRALAEQQNGQGSALSIQENFYNKATYSQSGEDAILSYVLNFIGYHISGSGCEPRGKYEQHLHILS